MRRSLRRCIWRCRQQTVRGLYTGGVRVACIFDKLAIRRIHDAAIPDPPPGSHPTSEFDEDDPHAPYSWKKSAFSATSIAAVGWPGQPQGAVDEGKSGFWKHAPEISSEEIRGAFISKPTVNVTGKFQLSVQFSVRSTTASKRARSASWTEAAVSAAPGAGEARSAVRFNTSSSSRSARGKAPSPNTAL